MASGFPSASVAPTGTRVESGARWMTPLGVVAILIITLAAYWNSFSGPFVFDDVPSIRDNASIHNWRDALFSPPARTTVAARPVLNASLALSYAIGGGATWGHHLVNYLIHGAAALMLAGLIRRTLQLPYFGGRFQADAGWIAFIGTALWALHPVQTESVTYLVQRAESLMGFFYLLTLFCFVRGAAPSCDPAGGGSRGRSKPRQALWLGAAVLVCALGMATKEVMVSAPVIVLLYDRTFLAGSFRQVWRQRASWHAVFATTWLVLFALMVQTGGNRGGSIGFGVGVSWWAHAATQFHAVVHYWRISFWPHPLVFEYEPEWAQRFLDWAPWAALVSGAIAFVLRAAWRNRPIGFLGLWFFAILAPTSFVPAPTQLIVEHRLYLGLAALIGAAVVVVYLRVGRHGLIGLSAVAMAFGALTINRNHDYRSELALWTDTVAKRPNNPLAQGSLGNALSRAGRLDEAFVHGAEAARLDPRNALLRYDLGVVCAKLGRMAEAIASYREAVRLEPNYAEAHQNLAVALAQMGERDEAAAEFATALRLRPNDAEAHYNFGALLGETGRGREAMEEFAAALRLKPDFAAACIAWGTELARAGRFDEALARYDEARRIDRRNLIAQNKSGLLLLALGRVPEAITRFETAVRINPNDAETLANLAMARTRLRPGASR